MREARAAADVAVALTATSAAGGGVMAATEAKEWHPLEGLLAAVALCCRWELD